MSAADENAGKAEHHNVRNHAAASVPAREPPSRFRRWAVGQFTRPHGMWGHVAGWIMARRNRERIDWTVSLLGLQPHHRVLELGFGPGYGIELMARQVTQGQVVGVDHSPVMHRHARRRNAHAIRDGRVRLRDGDVRHLAGGDERYDRVVAINVAQFWDDAAAVLERVRGVMVPGGVLALTVQPRNRNATDAQARAIGETLADAARRAGFAEVRVEFKPLRPVAAVCVLATRVGR